MKKRMTLKPSDIQSTISKSLLFWSNCLLQSQPTKCHVVLHCDREVQRPHHCPNSPKSPAPFSLSFCTRSQDAKTVTWDWLGEGNLPFSHWWPWTQTYRLLIKQNKIKRTATLLFLFRINKKSFWTILFRKIEFNKFPFHFSSQLLQTTPVSATGVRSMKPIGPYHQQKAKRQS